MIHNRIVMFGIIGAIVSGTVGCTPSQAAKQNIALAPSGSAVSPNALANVKAVSGGVRSAAVVYSVSKTGTASNPSYRAYLTSSPNVTVTTNGAVALLSTTKNPNLPTNHIEAAVIDGNAQIASIPAFNLYPTGSYTFTYPGTFRIILSDSANSSDTNITEISVTVKPPSKPSLPSAQTVQTIEQTFLNYIPKNEPVAPHDLEWLIDHYTHNGGYYHSGHIPGTMMISGANTQFEGKNTWLFDNSEVTMGKYYIVLWKVAGRTFRFDVFHPMVRNTEDKTTWDVAPFDSWSAQPYSVWVQDAAISTPYP